MHVEGSCQRAVANRYMERTFFVSHDGVIYFPGCTVVVCHGLSNAAHLNDKLGEVQGETLYVVGFEYKHLGSKLVKSVNLRIAFDLPD